MTMTKKNFRNGKLGDQRGFTLIEIIAVLVILAILAVIAVPKYMSLVADSKNKAAMGGVAEGMGRVNQFVASYMLRNNGSAPTAAAVVAAGTAVLGGDAGDFQLAYTATGSSVQVSANATGGNAQGGTATGIVKMPQ
jgi:prepilin-type N-terminal cleavage/methylation domain-containing protein